MPPNAGNNQNNYVRIVGRNCRPAHQILPFLTGNAQEAMVPGHGDPIESNRRSSTPYGVCTLLSGCFLAKEFYLHHRV
jgi:hypothetical protein